MPDSNQIVICVAGMHRSGTSMIARLLNLCGMDLGPEAEMMPASPANPEGYWEHIWFNYYNNQLLEFFRGAWDLVPVYPDQWEQTPAISWVRREAAEVIARFKSPIWGWKDPRNSITLPFWKAMVPHVKTLVCLRNPLDVANSLNKRGSSSLAFGLLLWWQYNSLILLGTTPAERVVSHFDAYFVRGADELQRLVKSLGMQASEAAVAEACKASDASLRHSVTNLEKLAKVTPWPGLMETYCKLLSESGEITQSLFASEWDKVIEYAARWTPQSCCLPTVITGHELQQKIKSLQDELEATAKASKQMADSANAQISELQAKLERVLASVAQVSCQRDEAIARVNEVMSENHAIKNSKTWKLLTRAGALGMRSGLVRNIGT